MGKTEGTGAHDDWGRVWADVALREWTAKFLGIPVEEVAKQVIFVLSGSVALLADLIHNAGDALTAVPLMLLTNVGQN